MKKTLLSCLAVMLLAILGAGTALACAEDPRPEPPSMIGHVQKKLEELKTNGVLNKDECDKVLAFFQEKEKQRHDNMEKHQPPANEGEQPKGKPGKEPAELINDLVKQTGISEDQAKVVAEALRPPRQPKE